MASAHHYIDTADDIYMYIYTHIYVRIYIKTVTILIAWICEKVGIFGPPTICVTKITRIHFPFAVFFILSLSIHSISH